MNYSPLLVKFAFLILCWSATAIPASAKIDNHFQKLSSTLNATGDEICHAPLDKSIAYPDALRVAIERCFIYPPYLDDGARCEIRVWQTPQGKVTRVDVQECIGHPKFGEFAERAVLKASPLPVPVRSTSFLPEFGIIFSPDVRKFRQSLAKSPMPVRETSIQEAPGQGFLSERENADQKKIYRTAYPPESRQAGEEGTTKLRVLVDAQGLPQTVELARSSGFSRLDKAAIDAAREWRFSPATDSGSPASAWVTVPVKFQLEPSDTAGNNGATLPRQQTQTNVSNHTSEALQKFQQMQRAAEQGDAFAQYQLALLFFSGEGTEKDLEKSSYWLAKAANQSHSNAQFYLGLNYLNGHGVKRAPDLAAEWLQRSAEQGNPNGQCELGALYLLGRDIQANPALGISWLRKAVAQGHAEAERVLGLAYLRGLGVRQDIVSGYALLALAKSNGNAAAERFLTRVESIIPKNNLEAAHTLAWELAKPGNILQALDRHISSLPEQ
ncbi:MAG: TonB family protein [Azonexus sp.]